MTLKTIKYIKKVWLLFRTEYLMCFLNISRDNASFQRPRFYLETRSLSPNEPPRLAKKSSKFQEKKTPLKG